MGKSVKKLYRVHSIPCPDLYIAERAGGWARWGKQEEAMKETQEWWFAELAPDWRKHFAMEEV